MEDASATPTPDQVSKYAQLWNSINTRVNAIFKIWKRLYSERVSRDRWKWVDDQVKDWFPVESESLLYLIFDFDYEAEEQIRIPISLLYVVGNEELEKSATEAFEQWLATRSGCAERTN